MDNVQEELETLRRDVEELKRVVAAIGPRYAPPSENPTDKLGEDLKEEIQKKGAKAGFSVMRVTYAHRINGGTSAGTTTNTWISAEDLPSVSRIQENMDAYSKHPLTIPALHRLMRQFFEGEWMRMTRTELAADLNTSEEELDTALNPLVMKEVVKLLPKPEGMMYEIGFPDPVLILLLA